MQSGMLPDHWIVIKAALDIYEKNLEALTQPLNDGEPARVAVDSDESSSFLAELDIGTGSDERGV